MSYPVTEDFSSAANFVADRSAGASVGGRLRPTAANTVTNVGHTSATSVGDQYGEIVIPTLVGTSEAGVYCRFTGAGPTYYQGVLGKTGAGYNAIIYKYSAGFQVLRSVAVNSTTLPATLRFYAIGGHLILQLGGTTVADADDVDFATGNPGTYVWTPTTLSEVEVESAFFDLPGALGAPYRVQSIGTAVSTNTNGPPNTLSISFAGTTKPVAGDTIVAYLARDNIANDPASGDSVSAAPGSDTYTLVSLAQPSGTSTANAGIVGSVLYSKIAADWPAGTNTFTVTMPSAAADRVLYVEQWRNLAGLRGTADTAGSTTNPSVTTTDPVAGDVVLAMACWEHSSASTITADSDTTNGTWNVATPTTALTSGGTTTAAVKLTTQCKFVTATGNQTYDPTNSTTTDSVAIALTFQPTTAPPTFGARRFPRALLAR